MPPPNHVSSRLRHDPARALGKRALASNIHSGSDSDPDSLFLPADDDDLQWEPAELKEDDEDKLGWDASASNVSGSNSGTLWRLLICSRTSHSETPFGMLRAFLQNVTMAQP